MDARALAAYVQAICASGQPVSFYDAHLAVRMARRLGGDSEPTLAALIALHDHREATYGARAVLADYLRALAQEQARERAGAARILEPEAQRRVRATVGSELRLALDERHTVIGVQGPGELVQATPARTATDGVTHLLRLRAVGLVRLEVRGKTAARLTLTVVVEPPGASG